MRPTLRLGTFAGINVGVHWSIGLIATLLVFSLAGTILPATAPGYAGLGYLVAALATTGLFLASIVAHELGHSVVAERNGVRVKGITLFALGGVATLDNEPASPGVAARIALAGPAVSVGVGVISLVAAVMAGVAGLPALAAAGLAWLGFVNLVLAVFNMVPALPLDGGRVLQAALWKRAGNQHRATIGAATIGRYLGWGLVLLGLWQLTVGSAGLWTAFIGLFVVTTARAEEFRARMALRATQWPGPWSPFGPSPTARYEPSGRATQDVIDVEGREVDSPA